MGAARAHNALDGAELAAMTIERMRAHQFPKTSVEHVIRNGGAMPNITPDRASIWINVRDTDYEKARQVYGYIKEMVEESAKVAGVQMVEGFLAGARGYLPNDTIGDVLWENLNKAGRVSYTEEELRTISELSRNATGVQQAVSCPEPIYLKGGVDPYSQDDGEASWHIPLGRLNWEIPQQIPLHNWATTALAGMQCTQKGALMCSKTIFLTVLDLFERPEIVLQAEEERVRRIQGTVVTSPEYDNLDVLIQNPESFWDGTWLNDRF